MARTFPRALGVKPAKWVSRKVFMAGADDTDNNPSTEFVHSSAQPRPRQAVCRVHLCKYFENSLGRVTVCRHEKGAQLVRPFEVSDWKMTTSAMPPPSASSSLVLRRLPSAR